MVLREKEKKQHLRNNLLVIFSRRFGFDFSGKLFEHVNKYKNNFTLLDAVKDFLLKFPEFEEKKVYDALVWLLDFEILDKVSSSKKEE